MDIGRYTRRFLRFTEVIGLAKSFSQSGEFGTNAVAA
jgi:hypothetical protein